MELISYLVIIAFVLLWVRYVYLQVKSALPENSEILWLDSKIELVRNITGNVSLFPVNNKLYDDLRVTPERVLVSMSSSVGVEGLTLSFDPDINSPGMIDGSGRIKVKNEYARNPNEIGAILAHEVAHGVMFKKWRFPQLYLDNEKLTDFCAVYLGFGKLLLNGHKLSAIAAYNSAFSNSLLLSESHLGYLSVNSLIYAYSRFCDERGISVFQRVAGLKSSVVFKVVLQWIFLRFTRPAKRLEYNELILHCASCKSPTLFQYQSVNLGMQKWRCSNCGATKVREIIGRRARG